MQVLTVNAGSTSTKVVTVVDGEAERAWPSLEEALAGPPPDCVAHRIVHGGGRTAATLVDERLASDRFLQGALELATRYEAILSFDVAVTEHASEETLRKRGLRPVQRLRSAGVLGKRSLLNHAADLDGADVDAIAEAGAGVCWTPSAAPIWRVEITIPDASPA